MNEINEMNEMNEINEVNDMNEMNEMHEMNEIQERKGKEKKGNEMKWNEMRWNKSGYLHFYTSAMKTGSPYLLSSPLGKSESSSQRETWTKMSANCHSYWLQLSESVKPHWCYAANSKNGILVHWLCSIRFLSQKSAKCGQGNEMSLAVPKFHGSVFG